MSNPYNSVGAKIGFDDASPQWSALEYFMRRIEDKFWCMDGPPVAYFEIPTIFRDPKVVGIQDLDPVRIVYQTIEFHALGDPSEEKVFTLCDLAWNEYFAPVLECCMPDDDFDRHSRLLFWRKRPMVGVDEEGNTKLRARLAVPGVQFERLVKPAITVTDAQGNVLTMSPVNLFPSPYEKRA